MSDNLMAIRSFAGFPFQENNTNRLSEILKQKWNVNRGNNLKFLKLRSEKQKFPSNST